jgi:chemotaxis protein methyltransferase CheR
VLRRLRDLLRPDGVLIVGTAETLTNGGGGLLTLCERDGVWFFANRPPELPPEVASAGAVSPARRPPAAHDRDPGGRTAVSLGACASAAPPIPAPPPPRDPGAVYREALALARRDDVAAARARLAPLCAAPTADPEHLCLLAHLLLECGELDGAHTAALRVLANAPWSLDALVLRGRIARAQGDLPEALDALRRAVYHDPEHWPAHLELAACQSALGNFAAARREYRILLRQLADAPRAAARLGPLPPTLALKDLRLLCAARLARLPAPTSPNLP